MAEIQLTIRSDRIEIIDCLADETIRTIKQRLCHVNPGFAVYCNGRIVADDTIVTDLESETLEICIPLKGGKIHGSLARAGKVRSQTPKVERQQKKKKKTGRAKKRAQYNRRILNPPSHGRGPNFNGGVPL